MTVNELINALQKLTRSERELPVRYVYDYGDRAHRMCAVEVEEIETATVVQSAYTGTMCLDDEGRDGSELAVVLR